MKLMGTKFWPSWSFILTGEGAEDKAHPCIISGTARRQNKSGDAAGRVGWVCVKDAHQKDAHQKNALCLGSQGRNLEVAGLGGF